MISQDFPPRYDSVMRILVVLFLNDEERVLLLSGLPATAETMIGSLFWISCLASFSAGILGR
jgi:hypothetical protein